MRAKKDKSEAMTIKELMTICKPLKQKDDGPIPKTKIELIGKYKEWHDRPTSTFDISDVNVMPVLEQESNENNDIVDDYCNSIAEKSYYHWRDHRSQTQIK